LIWTRGRILADEDLAISTQDRTFEHGLGLFETFRLWNGRATLLSRHLQRLVESAALLNIPLDPESLPAESDVIALGKASGLVGDFAVRLTLSGGMEGQAGSAVAWMRARPLPPPAVGGLRVGWGWPVVPGDRGVGYKSLNYLDRAWALSAAVEHGLDEMLRIEPSGRAVEGSRTNLFVVREGRVETTEALVGGGHALPGVMRALVLEQASKRGLQTVADRPGFTLEELAEADDVFLTNAVRGVLPVARVVGVGEPGKALKSPEVALRASGQAGRLWADLKAWLERGGID
jgi:branched-subunit amino acid aminotransferase/4-amino-4-deoxychorismate lyase